MSRQMDSVMVANLPNKLIYPVIFVDLTFRSSTQYVWSGIGNFNFAGQTYVGVGSLGKIGVIAEGSEINAQGTSVQLSGIDTALLQDCLTDIQLGAPAKISFGLLNANATLIGVPYTVFAGQVDKPTIEIGGKTLSITLALENRLVDLSRPSLTRYTSADQRLVYPTDISMSWVEQLNDLALSWGT